MKIFQVRKQASPFWSRKQIYACIFNEYHLKMKKIEGKSSPFSVLTGWFAETALDANLLIYSDVTIISFTNFSNWFPLGSLLDVMSIV